MSSLDSDSGEGHSATCRKDLLVPQHAEVEDNTEKDHTAKMINSDSQTTGSLAATSSPELAAGMLRNALGVMPSEDHFHGVCRCIYLGHIQEPLVLREE